MEYEKLQQATEWLDRQLAQDAPDLYWSGFNSRLRRRLAGRTAGHARPQRLVAAAAAILLISAAGYWALWNPSDKQDLAEHDGNSDATWYEESISYGTTLDYPASLQSDVEDLSTEEAQELLVELKDAVIL